MSTENPKKKVQQCAICRFDLSGQVPYFVGQYHLLAVRCPECGQEQPSGIVAQPWKFRRLKTTLMRVGWVWLYCSVLITILIALGAMAQSTAYASLQPFNGDIQDAYTQATRDIDSGTRLLPYGIEVQWWNSSGKELLAPQFDLTKHVDWYVLTDWFWFVLIGPIIGITARALMYESHWLAQTFLLGAPFLTALFGVWVYMESEFWYTSVSPIYCSMDIGGYWIGLPTCIIGMCSILISYFAATPVLRRARQWIPRLPELFPVRNPQSSS